jgi:hypothetical protein
MLSLVPIIIILQLFLSPTTYAVDFLYNSFNGMVNATNVTLINDARFDSSVIRFTNDSNTYSFGRAFYPTKLTMIRPTPPQTPPP